MGDVYLNGRRALDWELAAIGRGRECELAGDREQVAGVQAGEPEAAAARVPRPVTDLVLEFSHPGRRP